MQETVSCILLQKSAIICGPRILENTAANENQQKSANCSNFWFVPFHKIRSMYPAPSSGKMTLLVTRAYCLALVFIVTTWAPCLTFAQHLSPEPLLNVLSLLPVWTCWMFWRLAQISAISRSHDSLSAMDGWLSCAEPKDARNLGTGFGLHAGLHAGLLRLDVHCCRIPKQSKQRRRLINRSFDKDLILDETATESSFRGLHLTTQLDSCAIWKTWCSQCIALNEEMHMMEALMWVRSGTVFWSVSTVSGLPGHWSFKTQHTANPKFDICSPIFECLRAPNLRQ